MSTKFAEQKISNVNLALRPFAKKHNVKPILHRKFQTKHEKE